MTTIRKYAGLLRPQRRAEWSIGIYEGESPLELAPPKQRATSAVITRHSLRGLRAHGVSDPFMVRRGNDWFMFFEVDSRESGRGEIGLAASHDTVSWHFEGIVLREPFHLSYPHVWEFDGAHYMLPETSACGAVRLYKADPFPARWRFHAELVRGNLVDATPVRHGDKWWLMALEGFGSNDAFVIFFADRLEGPWHPHPLNPILSLNKRDTRPAGRVVPFQGSMIRFAQDCERHYGRMVKAFQVEELTTTTYAERLVGGDAILRPTGHGWNATGMHHVDAHQVGPHRWLAAVDGRRTVWRWPLYERAVERVRRYDTGRRPPVG